MANVFEVEVTVPEGCKEGDIFTVQIEAPKAERKLRGQLAGIALADMTEEQIKREIINANSVLYKAIQRGAAAETIAANQARVDAAKAEKEKRFGSVAKVTDAPNLESEMEGENESENESEEEI